MIVSFAIMSVALLVAESATTSPDAISTVPLAVGTCRSCAKPAEPMVSGGAPYEDLGGPAIESYLQEVLESPYETTKKIISDDQKLIEKTIIELCDSENCALVVTTGGTGPAERDVTPEATESVCQKMMPGFGELMRQVSLKKVPTAILSRQTAGIRNHSLIVNLPGKPKAIAECLDGVFAAIPYCIDLIEGPFLVTNESRFVAFRPKK